MTTSDTPAKSVGCVALSLHAPYTSEDMLAATRQQFAECDGLIGAASAIHAWAW